MTGKPIVPRTLARDDLESAVNRYAADAGTDVALGLIDAVEDSYRLISDHPAIGSPRFGQELDLPGLRTRRVKLYPYLIFYVERADHIDIWRILHAHADIPDHLGDDAE